MDDPFDLPPDVLQRIPLFAELSKVLSWSGGPVNWDLATQIAASIAAGERPPAAPTADDQRQVSELTHVAQMWLAEVMGASDPLSVEVRAGSRTDWAEHACRSFAELIDPVAAKVATAMREQAGDAAGAESPMLTQALGQMAPMFTGIQTGTILGNLAGEVTGSHDIVVPPGDEPPVIILEALDAVASEYRLDPTLVRQWVTLRAVAHRLAFEGFPRARFFSLYHNYIATLNFDFSASLRRLAELDLSDPSRLQDALGDEDLFSHDTSPGSRAAAEEIGRFQSVVGAQIDAAVRAASVRLGATGPIEEAFRRRTGGEGMQMLTRFIGLEPAASPRAGTTFVESVLATGGWETLSRLWEDPEGYPSSAEIDDPDAWLRRVGR